MKISDHTKKFLRINSEAVVSAIDRMSLDLVMLSKMKVPQKEGDLFASVKIDKKNKYSRRVSYNTDYAANQERGYDEFKVYRKYTTPGTGSHYLSDAGKKVEQNALNYIKQAIISAIPDS